MAKVLTAEKHGSVGLSTFQRSRHGLIERQRAVPLDPNTFAQQTHRGIVQAVASAWPHLSEEARAGWKTLAAQLRGNLTGAQVHNRVNVVLAKCGLPVRETAPPLPVLGRLSCAGLQVEELPLVKLTQVSVTGAVDRLVVEACRPLRPSIDYIQNRWRFLTAVAVPAGAPVDLDLTAAYVARFLEPSAGQRVFVRLCTMKDGFKDAPLQLSASVAARGA